MARHNNEARIKDEMCQLLDHVYMHLGDQEYEINRLKVKILTYEGYLEGLDKGDLIIDEYYLSEDKH